MSSREKLNKQILLTRQIRILKSKESFWEFCKTVHSDFYTPDRSHLKELCDVLQNLYEGNLTNEQAEIYDKLIINYPPQHGKSRTLVLFCCWCLGKNPKEKIITVSYNDDLASDFSKYVRDEIEKTKKHAHEIIYNDIFPKTKTKFGTRAYKKWAIEGQPFSYIGTGMNGTITGKGGTIRIIDDPIKSAFEANNPNVRQEHINWYKGTWLSRRSGKRVIDIINMTRWHEQDLCGYVLSRKSKNKWKVFRRPVMDKDGKMLCDDLLSREAFQEIQDDGDPFIVSANYFQKTLSQEDKLYKIRRYQDIPRKADGTPYFKFIGNFTDTADLGDDYLCSINVGIGYDAFIYILSILYTRDGQEMTEPKTAYMLDDDKVNKSYIESNNGGRAFYRNIERILRQTIGNKTTSLEWFHQSENKQTRIITNSSIVNNIVLFPPNIDILYPEFYDHISSYQRIGKNKYDDGPDVLSGIVEKFGSIAIVERPAKSKGRVRVDYSDGF